MTEITDHLFSELSAKTWLKELQEKLKIDAVFASETLAQAQPVFYTIMDYRYDIVPDDYGDIIRYIDSDADITYDPKSALESLIENERATAEEIANSAEGQMLNITFDENNKLDSSVSEYHICWFLDDSPIAEHLTRHSFVKVSFIVPDTMFLTHAEAAEHLKANYYHYTKDAHTYAMTAWRSFQVRDLLRLLRAIDFDASDIKLKDMLQ